MADRNSSHIQPEVKPDLLEWHGAEVIFMFVMILIGCPGNGLVLYVTHFRWEKSIFNFFIKVRTQLNLKKNLEGGGGGP